MLFSKARNLIIESAKNLAKDVAKDLLKDYGMVLGFTGFTVYTLGGYVIYEICKKAVKSDIHQVKSDIHQVESDIRQVKSDIHQEAIEKKEKFHI